MVVIVNRSRTTEMISKSIVSFEILLTSVLKWEYHPIYEGCMGLYTRGTGRSHIHRHMHVLCVDAQTFQRTVILQKKTNMSIKISSTLQPNQDWLLGVVFSLFDLHMAFVWLLKTR